MSIVELLKLAIEERTTLPPQLVIQLKGADLIELFKFIKEEISKDQIQTPIQHEEILNVAGASKLTGYAEQTIYVMVSKKQIPYMKRGAKVLFERDRLMDWMKENRVEPKKKEEEKEEDEDEDEDEIEQYLSNSKKKNKRA